LLYKYKAKKTDKDTRLPPIKNKQYSKKIEKGSRRLDEVSKITKTHVLIDDLKVPIREMYN